MTPNGRKKRKQHWGRGKMLCTKMRHFLFLLSWHWKLDFFSDVLLAIAYYRPFAVIVEYSSCKVGVDCPDASSFSNFRQMEWSFPYFDSCKVRSKRGFRVQPWWLVARQVFPSFVSSKLYVVYHTFQDLKNDFPNYCSCKVCMYITNNCWLLSLFCFDLLGLQGHANIKHSKKV